jgi:hypothetical protein
MVSPGMLRHVALVGADISEELGASIIGVTRVSNLRATLAVAGGRRMLRRNAKYCICIVLYFFIACVSC